jgi:hypothetical protein
MDYNKIISISSATFIAEIITLPICTIKTIYQNNNHLNTVQTIQKIYSENKLKGFFNASKPAIISQIISTTSKYIFYKKYPKSLTTHKLQINYKKYAFLELNEK